MTIADMTRAKATRKQVDSPLKKLVPLLGNLYARWLDEQDYEDINEYGAVIARALPDNIQFIRMTKRPFGFRFIAGRTEGFMSINSKEAKWGKV